MKRLLVRTLLATVAAVLSTVIITWYASMYQHLPDSWPRVYIASECSASEFAMMVAKQSDAKIAMIPLDNGSISERACHHTRALLEQESTTWAALRSLPDSLVCARLIKDGSEWMSVHRYDEWPVIVGPRGGIHFGADIEGLRSAGLEVSDQDYAQLVGQFEQE